MVELQQPLIGIGVQEIGFEHCKIVDIIRHQRRLQRHETGLHLARAVAAILLLRRHRRRRLVLLRLPV